MPAGSPPLGRSCTASVSDGRPRLGIANTDGRPRLGVVDIHARSRLDIVDSGHGCAARTERGQYQRHPGLSRRHDADGHERFR